MRMPDDTSFDPVAAARRLLRTARHGALATRRPEGAPFASLVAVATLPSGAPVLLLSDLAVHTKNLAGDVRAALLLDEAAGGDPLECPRVTIEGRMTRLAAGDPALEQARRRFLARHPAAAGYAGFADFAFWTMAVEEAHLVAGFGRIVDLAAGELLTGLSGAEALLAAEADAVAHMNEDHADALALYATRLCGAPDGAWIATGLDPDGLDLMTRDGGHAARLAFSERIDGAPALRSALVALAAQARAAA
jgi:putative heme iron utilization protein